MPIHLPAFSRRRFLRDGAMAGTALALRPLFGASNVGLREDWALLADPHIPADPATAARGVVMAEHLRAVAAEIAGQPDSIAGVLIAGDCALHDGQTADYALLAQLLAPVRAAQLPVWLALGNHDHRENFWSALPDEKARRVNLPQHHASLVPSAQANWFLLDSLEHTLSTPGYLGAAQLAWLAAALDAHADRPALVLIHHNPGDHAGVPGIKDTAELLAVLRPRRHVKAYFFGHTHQWGVTRDESGLHLVNLPPVAYVFREGLPSGWVRARLGPRGARLELRALDRRHPAHGEVVDLEWRT